MLRKTFNLAKPFIHRENSICARQFKNFGHAREQTSIIRALWRNFLVISFMACFIDFEGLRIALFPPKQEDPETENPVV